MQRRIHCDGSPRVEEKLKNVRRKEECGAFSQRISTLATKVPSVLARDARERYPLSFHWRPKEFRCKIPVPLFFWSPPFYTLFFGAGFSLARSGISFVLGSEKCIDSVEIIQIRCMVNRPSEQRKKKRPPENIKGKNPILLKRRSCWWVEKERKRLRDLFRVIFKLLSAPCSNFPLSVRLGAHSVSSSARRFFVRLEAFFILSVRLPLSRREPHVCDNDCEKKMESTFAKSIRRKWETGPGSFFGPLVNARRSKLSGTAEGDRCQFPYHIKSDRSDPI